MMKNKLLMLGLLATPVAPLVSVISCGGSETSAPDETPAKPGETETPTKPDKVLTADEQWEYDTHPDRYSTHPLMTPDDPMYTYYLEKTIADKDVDEINKGGKIYIRSNHESVLGERGYTRPGLMYYGDKGEILYFDFYEAELFFTPEEKDIYIFTPLSGNPDVFVRLNPIQSKHEGERSSGETVYNTKGYLITPYGKLIGGIGTENWVKSLRGLFDKSNAFMVADGGKKYSDAEIDEAVLCGLGIPDRYYPTGTSKWA